MVKLHPSNKWPLSNIFCSAVLVKWHLFYAIMVYCDIKSRPFYYSVKTILHCMMMVCAFNFVQDMISALCYGCSSFSLMGVYWLRALDGTIFMWSLTMPSFSPQGPKIIYNKHFLLGIVMHACIQYVNVYLTIYFGILWVILFCLYQNLCTLLHSTFQNVGFVSDITNIYVFGL